MKKRIKTREAGFTLIELIVSMAILVIVVGAVSMLMEPSMRVYSEGANLARAKRMADDVSELIVSELLYAKDLTVTETWGEGSLNGAGKQVTFVSPSYGKMTLTQYDTKQIYMTQDSTGKSLGFGDDYFMQNGAMVGITLQDPQITVAVCMLDRAGEVILVKERTVKRLNEP